MGTQGPEAVDDAYLTARNTILSVPPITGVLANDAAGNGGVLVAVEGFVDSEAGAVVQIEPSGAFHYEPLGAWHGVDAFVYVVRDEHGNEASGMVQVTVRRSPIPLAEVADGIGGFSIDGGAAGDALGVSAAGIGDYDGDGISDLAIGVPGADSLAMEGGGAVIVRGKADDARVELDGNPSAEWSWIQSAGAGAELGFVAAAGDVNGDGLADVVLASFTRTYVVFGRADGGTIDTETLEQDGLGFEIVSESGYVNGVSGGGDVNGDGLDDVIVAVFDGDVPRTVYVVFGKASATAVDLATVAMGTGGFGIEAEFVGDDLGLALDNAGDVNGDGRDDVLLGAARAPVAGDHSGRVYVVFGKDDGGTIALGSISNEAGGGFAVDGEAPGAAAGVAVRRAGDVDGDGRSDVILGAVGSRVNGQRVGRAYVVRGKGDPARIALADVAAGTIGGFAINGTSEEEPCGIAVAGIGDVDGDGLVDFAIGAENSTDGLGRVYVVFGREEDGTIELADVAEDVGGFLLVGEQAYDGMAYVLDGASDLDRDADAELLIGASGVSLQRGYEGRAYLVRGSSTGTRLRRGSSR